MMSAAWEKWYGDSLAEPDPLFWASKLHFYISGLSFYNFPYLFGYLFSLGVHARRDALGDDFFPRYVALLRDTGRMTAEDLAAKHLDADLTRPDFWRATVATLESRIDRFRSPGRPGFRLTAPAAGRGFGGGGSSFPSRYPRLRSTPASPRVEPSSDDSAGGSGRGVTLRCVGPHADSGCEWSRLHDLFRHVSHPSPEISPTFCCGRRSMRCDWPYSLKPLRRSVDYAFSVFQSVRASHSAVSTPSRRKLVRFPG